MSFITRQLIEVSRSLILLLYLYLYHSNSEIPMVIKREFYENTFSKKKKNIYIYIYISSSKNNMESFFVVDMLLLFVCFPVFFFFTFSFLSPMDKVSFKTSRIIGVTPCRD